MANGANAPVLKSRSGKRGSPTTHLRCTLVAVAEHMVNSCGHDKLSGWSAVPNPCGVDRLLPSIPLEIPGSAHLGVGRLTLSRCRLSYAFRSLPQAKRSLPFCLCSSALDVCKLPQAKRSPTQTKRSVAQARGSVPLGIRRLSLTRGKPPLTKRRLPRHLRSDALGAGSGARS